MFIQLHKPKSTGEIISLERRLYEVVQKEWDSQEPTGHSFAQQTQKDVSTICHLIGSRGNNRPFQSYLVLLCLNKFSCKTIHVKMCSAYRFIFIQIKLTFMWKVCNWRLVLKPRHEVSRKWPMISSCSESGLSPQLFYKLLGYSSHHGSLTLIWGFSGSRAFGRLNDILKKTHTQHQEL